MALLEITFWLLIKLLRSILFESEYSSRVIPTVFFVTTLFSISLEFDAPSTIPARSFSVILFPAIVLRWEERREMPWPKPRTVFSRRVLLLDATRIPVKSVPFWMVKRSMVQPSIRISTPLPIWATSMTGGPPPLSIPSRMIFLSRITVSK